MNILICLSNHILAAGVRQLICENLAEAGQVIDDPDLVCGPPDLVLFDARDAADRLMQEYPGARFLCFDLGMSNQDLACLLYCHGISGIIATDLDVDMFCKALRTVYRGDLWIDQGYLRTLFREGRSLPDRDGAKGLSSQDRRIVAMVAAGMKNRDIAAALFLSLPTIKAHLSRIYRILNLRNRAQLVALAAESGWLPATPHSGPHPVPRDSAH